MSRASGDQGRRRDKGSAERRQESSQEKRHQGRILARQMQQNVHRENGCDDPQHPVIGDTWVLPSPADGSKPCSRDPVKTWWRRAESRSGLPPVKGRGWHSLRRKFATERKDQSLRDLCELGGSKNPVAVLRCYQRPDTERMREVLANRKPLRAAEGG